MNNIDDNDDNEQYSRHSCLRIHGTESKKKIKKKTMCGKKQKNVTSRYKCHLPKKILIVLIELEWSTRRRIPERK